MFQARKNPSNPSLSATSLVHVRRINPETFVIFVAWLVTLTVALILAAVTRVPSPLKILLHEGIDNINRNWYWVGAVLPSNLVAIAASKDDRERIRLGGIAVAIAVCCAALALPIYGLKTAVYVGIKCAAIFGVLVLCRQWKGPGGAERLLVVVMFATYLAIRLSYLPLTYMVRGDTFDLYTFAFDSSLGFNIAALLFFLYHTFHLFGALLNSVYVFVLVLPLSLYAAQIYSHDPNTVPMLRVFVVATALGFICYFVFPACGPVYLFGSSEQHLAVSGPPHPVPLLGCWRNGVPSVHFGLALLMAINVPRSLRAVKLAFIGYCALTFMATMGNGEHYFADLAAALPFVCAVQGLCLWLNAPLYRQYLMAGLRSAVIFAGFLAFLIVGPESLRTPPVSWTILALLVMHFLWERHGWWKVDVALDDPHVANHDALVRGPDSRDPCNP